MQQSSIISIPLPSLIYIMIDYQEQENILDIHIIVIYFSILFKKNKKPLSIFLFITLCIHFIIYKVLDCFKHIRNSFYLLSLLYFYLNYRPWDGTTISLWLLPLQSTYTRMTSTGLVCLSC